MGVNQNPGVPPLGPGSIRCFHGAVEPSTHMTDPVPTTLASSADMPPAPVLAGPVPLADRLKLTAMFRTLRDNPLKVYTDEAYEELIVEFRLLTLRTFLVSDPEGIKHVGCWSLWRRCGNGCHLPDFSIRRIVCARSA